MNAASGRLAIAGLGVLIAVAMPALAQSPAASSQAFISPKDIKWSPAPASLPKGAMIAVLQGDPGKAGPFVIRIQLPAGYKVPPHWHSQDEHLTVISGTFYIGMGDHYEPSTARGLPAGGFHFLPARAHHYAFAKKPAVVQVNGNGPFDITYINPAEDPRKGQ